MVQSMARRITVAALILLCSAVGYAADEATGLERIVAVRIEAQPLSTALIEFSKQARVQVITPAAKVKDLATQGVHGEMPLQQALTRLLEGTQLGFHEAGANTIGLDESGPKKEPSAVLHDEKSLQLAQTASPQTPMNSADSNSYEASDLLEEVVVTAQKREESIKNVPMSITALSGVDLERRNLTNAEALSFSVPGLSVVNQGGGRLDISIRGIQSYRGNSSLTGLYVDEAPISGPQDGFIAGYMNVSTLDLERVEVLKGPQGTLFGEGAVGGVIRYITNDPDLSEVSGRVTVGLSGTESAGANQQATGVLNLPVIQDVFGIRLAATGESNAGWIDNVSTGEKKINDNELGDVRFKGLWKPGSTVEVSGLVEIHRDHGDGGNIVNVKPYESGKFVQAFDPDFPTDYQDDFEIYNLAVNFDLGFGSLLSSTSHSDTTSRIQYSQYAAGTPPPSTSFPLFEAALPNYMHWAHITSQELRLTSTIAGPFKWSLGGSYKKSRLRSGFPDGFNAYFFYHAVSFVGLGGMISTVDAEGWAGFADASYTIADRVEIGGGARYYSDHLNQFNNVPGDPFFSGTFKKPTYRGYVRYAATDRINLYANVGTGFRSGGFNAPIAIANGAPATFAPETAVSYELGAKTVLLNGRASFDVAAYRGEYKDQFQNVQGLGFAYTINQGSARIDGIELQLNLVPIDRLRLTVGGGWIDTEYTRVLPTASSIVGDPLSFVPQYDIMLAANYGFQWPNAIPGNMDLSYTRRGKIHAIARGNFNADPVIDVTRPIDLLQARVEADLKGFQLGLFATNLLDERGPLQPSNGGIYPQARPRTIGISLGREF